MNSMRNRTGEYESLSTETIMLSDVYSHAARDTVNIICGQCGGCRQLKVRSLRDYVKAHGVDKYTCKSCTSKNAWQPDEKRKKASQCTSDAWERGDYSNLSNTIHNLYNTNPEYKLKTSKGVKKAYLTRPKYKECVVAALVRDKNWTSNLQQQLYSYLDDLNAIYYREGSETIIGHYVFDCLVKTPPDRRDILIECQGIYWHGLPGSENRDSAKFTYIDRYFPEYEIMYIWEDEFSAKERVLDRLKLKLGLTIRTENFTINDVEVREAPRADYKSFLDAYHYIGKGRGGRCYGAYISDKLIACCVFSPPVRQNMGNKFGEFVEISRFCIHPSYHKKNLASWFISRCIKLAKPPKVIAYADTTVGHTGVIYKAANFILSHEVPADYWYVDADGYVMRKKRLYDKAVKNHMTESEFASRFGYIKKWGGKKFCFIFTPKSAL